MGPLIVVEGVDLVGKTTLCQALAAILQMEYWYGLDLTYKKIRAEIEERQDFNTRFFYYLGAVIAMQGALRKRLEEGNGVVMDRYIYSTFATHRALGVEVTCVDLQALPIVQPDHVVLLTASTEVRRKRAIKRGSANDQRFEQQESILENAQRYFLEYNLPHIDTDALTKFEVSSAALDVIRGRRNHA